MARLDFSGVIELLDQAQNVALCGHMNPDGDCLGSVLALTHALRAQGKQATPLLATTAQPEIFDYLEGYGEMIPAAQYDGTPDLFVMLDVPNEQRMVDGADVMARAAHKVKIDHHDGPTDIVDASVIDTDAAAVGVMVWELLEQWGVEPTPLVADCCYVALLTDTGSFRFQNADARAFEAAAAMVKAGANPAIAATNVYQRKSLAAVALEARVGARARFACGGRMVISWMEQADLDELGATKDDCEELTDVVRQIAGPEVSVILRGQGESIRGSIRAKGGHDVRAIALQMNGGGHKAASGFTLYGDMDKAIQHVVDLVAESFGVTPENMAQ